MRSGRRCERVSGAKTRRDRHLAARAGVRPSVQSRSSICGPIFSVHLIFSKQPEKTTFHVSFLPPALQYIGAIRELPFREDQPLRQTLSPLRSTKLAGEQSLFKLFVPYGFQVVCSGFSPSMVPPTSGPFDSSIHSSDRARQTDRSVRRWFCRARFYYVDDIIQGVLSSIDFEAHRSMSLIWARATRSTCSR